MKLDNYLLKPMLKMSLTIWLLIPFSALPSYAQGDLEQCGTVPFNNLKNKKGSIDREAAKLNFERWISDQKRVRKSKLRSQSTTQTEPVLTIPVVVHVIHRGEAVGEGSNIPIEQVEDQIRTLNEDFRRLNPDRSQTLPQFQDLAADVGIEFVLARQSPGGFATTGVTRTEGVQSDYNLNSSNTLSNLSYWPANDYFNIWVAPLSGGLLGFAQFPISDLDGLEGASNNAETDGIVVDYRYFGGIGNVVSNSRGRTTSHEVGHFLGLRHIWGDGDCSADDFVADTPQQESESSGCPIDQFSCGSLDMFQNYMDYTTDACMNLFTLEQKERMRIVLQNSPRRASLLVSRALIEPAMVENDAGIERILEPRESACNNVVTPTINIYNGGTNPISSVKILLFLQGNLVEERSENISLQTGEQTSLSFSTIEFDNSGAINTALELSFQIVEVNGVQDNNPSNNSKTISFLIPRRGTLPLTENFEQNTDTALQNQGVILNPDDLTTWTLSGAPGFDGPDNQALYLNFFDYEQGIGERDILYTPIYDFSNVRRATLSIRYAYAPYIEDGVVTSDRLIIGLSTDCGSTIEEILFDATGDDLATMEAQNDSFEPRSRADWNKLEFQLDDYSGNPNISFVITGVNNWGNNLYIDDIEINFEESNSLDLAVEEIISPARLSCIENPVPEVRIRNQGSSSVVSFEVTYQLDDQPATSFVSRDFPIEPEASELLTFEQLTLTPGLHTLSVGVSSPNLLPDEDPADNFLTYSFFVSQQQDVVPLVQEFNEGRPLPDVLNGSAITNEQDWLVVNPDGATGWETVQTEGNGFNNTSAFINLYDYQNTGATDQLVSPVLDFSDTEEASIFFKVSYASLSESYADTLRLKASFDCGLTYQILYERSGMDLAILSDQDFWTPLASEDWRQEYINLSSYAGEPEVRLAFEVVNAYGNNLYLDDIEVFTSSDNDPVSQLLSENSYRIFPNPYSPTTSLRSDGFLKLAINLRDREDVRIVILDSQGRLISDQIYPFTLNQTYQFDLQSLPAGMYIFRVLGNSINTTQQLIKQ